MDVLTEIHWAEAKWKGCPSSLIRNNFADCLGDGTQKDLDATSDDCDAETLSSMARGAQEHVVFVSSAWLNEILHVDGEEDVTEEVSNSDVAEEIADLHGSDTDKGDTGSMAMNPYRDFKRSWKV